MSEKNKVVKAESIKNSLTQNFQNYISEKETPSEELRERVFNTLSNFELTINVIDLFTVKFIEAELKFFTDLNDYLSGEK